MYISKVALAEWLRRVPAKYMGFPRESSNLSSQATNCFLVFYFLIFAGALKTFILHLEYLLDKSYVSLKPFHLSPHMLVSLVIQGKKLWNGLSLPSILIPLFRCISWLMYSFTYHIKFLQQLAFKTKCSYINRQQKRKRSKSPKEAKKKLPLSSFSISPLLYKLNTPHILRTHHPVAHSS